MFLQNIQRQKEHRDMSAEAIALPAIEQRQDERVSYQGAFDYTYEGNKGEAYWSSMSHDGACISMRRYLRPGRLIRISQDGHEIFGTVIWCKPKSRSTFFIAGIRFTDGSAEASFMVLSAMVQQMVRSRRNRKINR